MKRRKPALMVVGADLTSNGGIASVVKSYQREYRQTERSFDLILLKTNHYEDRNRAWELVIFISSSIKALLYLATRDVRVVHIHSSSGPSFFRKCFFVLYSKLFRKPTILHLHASAFYEFFLTRNRLLRTWIGAILRFVDLTIVLCKDWEKELLRHYPGIEVTTVPNPIDTSSIVPEAHSRSRDVFEVLFMGFLIPSKGIDDLLSVATRLADGAVEGVRIVVAGKGELEPRVRSFVTGGRSDILEFRGWVSGDEKTRLLQNADLCFLPSYKEGMPIVILEAMSYGLPIVSTRISGIPDLVEDGVNGYLFAPGDVDGFCRAILDLASDRERMDAFREASFEKAKRFDTKLVFGRLLEIYRDLAQLSG